MTTTFYLLDNEHLDTLREMMQPSTNQDVLFWHEGIGGEGTADKMEALINKAVPTHSEQSITVSPLVVPEGQFVVGVGVAWYEDDGKISSKNSDLFPQHLSGHSPLTSLLCLRRDIGNVLVPQAKRVRNKHSVGFTLDNLDGYYALRINGLYQ